MKEKRLYKIMELANIIDKSIKLANKNKYIVRFYELDNTTFKEVEISYMELGTFLISQKNFIKLIHIYPKSE